MCRHYIQNVYIRAARHQKLEYIHRSDKNGENNSPVLSDIMRQRKLPRILEDDQREAMLAQFDLRYPSGMKNLCMARLMLDAGLRVSELVDLKPGHLNMTTCKLTVIEGKGGKDRILWVSEDLRDVVGRWLERRPESPWLFPTRTGSQTHRQSVHRTIQHYADKANIPDAHEIGPHTLRHTFATRLYRETKNIRLVQKALGHADLATTMIYTHIVDEELASALQTLGA